MLQKDIDKHEDQMVEARRTIRSLQKRNKDGPQTGIMWHKGTQTTMEVNHQSTMHAILMHIMCTGGRAFEGVFADVVE